MNKRKPLFTVLLPVYNAEAYLGDAIESILKQTVEEFEFLIIDDGSTDASLEIIRKYAANDTRIRVISRPNKGFVKTLEEGLHEAQADIIARMDADDIAVPDRLRQQFEFLEANKDYAIVGCQVRLMSQEGALNSIDPRPTEDQNLKLFLAFGCALSGPTVMFRKEAVTNVGGFLEEAWPAEDYDCWTRMVMSDATMKMHILPDVLYHYRLNDEGISLTNKRAQVDQTNTIGRTYRYKMLRQGWKFLTLRKHKGWFSDLSHLEDEEQKYRLKSNYYALQTWFIHDQRSLNRPKAFWNNCKLHLFTWLVNPEDKRLIKGQPSEHNMPTEEG